MSQSARSEPRVNEIPLSVALIHLDTVEDDILLEMLEHQGASVEIVRGHSPKKCPVAMLSRSSPEGLALAAASCLSKENIVIADEIVDLEGIRRLLGGLEERKADHFDLPVNEAERKLMASIGERMKTLALPLVLKSFWPGGAPAACVLTHDIDWLSYSPFHRVVWREVGSISRFLSLAYNGLVKRRNYGWNIPEVVALEKQYGFRSTFFFRAYYRERGYLERSMRILKNDGFEIGLHGANASHESTDALKAELEAFQGSVGSHPRGLRYHILKFKPPDTWAFQSQLGLEYDATFGFNRFLGFRGGSCFPYHPFTATERLPVLELPTGFMDSAALRRSPDGSRFGEYLEMVKKRVEEFQGALVVNFHNTYLNGETFPPVMNEYEGLLRAIRDQKFWVATAAECTEWWRRRASFRPNPRMTEGGEVLVDVGEGVLLRTFEPSDTDRLRNSLSPNSKGVATDA